jgi:primary-amine oxidase
MASPVTAAPATTHPLEQLSADDVSAAREVLDAARLVGESTRFVYVGLEEPPKSALYGTDAVPDRRVRVLLHDVARPNGRDVVVSVTERAIVSDRVLDAATDGQLPVLDEEFALVEEVLATDERWLAALAARDLDVADVRVAPLSAGVFEYRRRRAGGSCAGWPSGRTTRRTTPGRTRSTASSPTSTSWRRPSTR